MKKQIVTAATLVLAGIIAGCGGGGTSASGTPSASALTAVSGKVADGYLVNATVFMDKNGNYQLDPGEPNTTTDANGAYTLNVDPADVGQYPIVAIAVKDVTKDMDTNQTVTSTYLMSLPKDAVTGTVSSNFISPMSTQLREMMATDQYTSMAQAMEALRAKLGLPAGTNMLSDFMATQNGAMHTAAQNMANAMGNQMSQVFGAAGTPTGINVNRYRNMMGTIFSNMSTVQGLKGQGAMTTLMTNMNTNLGAIQPGLPFQNMSSLYRGMMGGQAASGSGTTGSSTAAGSVM